jgi:hypothetical protein
MEYMATMLKTTLLPMYLVPTDWKLDQERYGRNRFRNLIYFFLVLKFLKYLTYIS